MTVGARRAGVLAVLLLLAACGGGSGGSSGGGGGGAAGQSTGAPAASSTAAGAPTLKASVGTQDSADAFKIALVDADGKPVTDLPAGQYNIEVTDYSTVHDFHLHQLSGGSLDERTDVAQKQTTTWVVTLSAGDYRYMCDPHPSMNGHFTVH